MTPHRAAHWIFAAVHVLLALAVCVYMTLTTGFDRIGASIIVGNVLMAGMHLYALSERKESP